MSDSGHDLDSAAASPSVGASGAESAPEPDDALRAMLRGALREEEPAPDVLAGVQRKIRERSKGKFYADGWSTAKHPPLNTYLVTSLLMLAILGISYALMSPLVGSPQPVKNEPAPIRVMPR